MINKLIYSVRDTLNMILVLLIFICASVNGYVVPDKYYIPTQQHGIQHPFVRQPGIRYPITQHPVMQYPAAYYPGLQYPCLNIQCVGCHCPFNGGYIQQYPIEFNAPTVKQIPAEEPTTISTTSPVITTLLSSSKLTSYLPTSTTTEAPTTSGVTPA